MNIPPTQLLPFPLKGACTGVEVSSESESTPIRQSESEDDNEQVKHKKRKADPPCSGCNRCCMNQNCRYA